MLVVASPAGHDACTVLFSSRSFVETDGQGYDRVRRTPIGKKYFKLTHFEEVSTPTVP